LQRWRRRACLFLRIARRIDRLERTRRRRTADWRRGTGQPSLQRLEPVDRRIAIRLRRFVARAIDAVAGSQKFQKRVGLIERNGFSLASGANELLAGERGISYQRLQSRFSACPEIDDICGQIFGVAWRIEMRENGANAVQSGERRL
jgi:hypothetical protein